MTESEKLVALFRLGVETFGERVHAVRDWDAPTPDDEWSVADLIGHLIEEHLWFAPLLHGQSLESAGKIVEGTRSLPADGGVGADLAQQWDEASRGSMEAITKPGALDVEVELSRGKTPADIYASEMISDLVVHSWDLGAAIGFGDPVPDELIQYVLPMAEQFGDLSATGLFKAPVSVPDSAPSLDRLVALTGRDPGWRPPA